MHVFNVRALVSASCFARGFYSSNKIVHALHELRALHESPLCGAHAKRASPKVIELNAYDNKKITD